MSTPEIGSVWREDYAAYAGTDYERRVKVIGFAEDGRAIIQAAESPNGRKTRAKVERFGRKGGYLPVGDGPQMRTPYTIAQVDEAMRQIVNDRAVRPGDYGWSRTTAMLAAASHAWITQRPEDEHSAILRSALMDLNKHGFMRPLGKDTAGDVE